MTRIHSMQRQQTPACMLRVGSALSSLVAASCILGVTPQATPGLDLVPQDRQVLCGPACAIDVPVLLSGTGALDAVGFDLLFDTDKLEYRAVRRGECVRGWAAFDAELLPGGRLRVGGFDAAPFALAGTETLAVLAFDARVPAACTTYHTDQLVDDLASAPVRSGSAAWGGWEYPANGYVALYPSGEQPSCCYDVPDGTTLVVVARTAGVSAAGVAGAEFRIEISPPAPGALVAWTPAAGVATSVGDPVDNSLAAGDSSGVRLLFGSCQLPVDSTIPLGTLTVRGLAGAHDLLVKRHNRPANGTLPCAQWTLCDSPTCEIACQARTLGSEQDPVVFRARVNDPACRPENCGFVPVVPRTWGEIKQRYR